MNSGIPQSCFGDMSEKKTSGQNFDQRLFINLVNCVVINLDVDLDVQKILHTSVLSETVKLFNVLSITKKNQYIVKSTHSNL